MTHKKLDHVIAVSALSLGVLAGDMAPERASEHTPPQPAGIEMTLNEEREIVAGRVANCDIEAVVDHHVSEKREDGAERNTLDVTVSFQDTEQAKRVRTKYEDDDTVFWHHPKGVGVIAAKGTVSNPPRPHDVPVMSSPFSEFATDEAGTHSFKLYPRDTYEAGDVINIYVETEAMTSNDETFTTTNTYANCGSLILEAARVKGNVTWEISSGAPKLPSYSETRAQN